jgi:hypothetical protein
MDGTSGLGKTPLGADKALGAALPDGHRGTGVCRMFNGADDCDIHSHDVEYCNHDYH